MSLIILYLAVALLGIFLAVGLGAMLAAMRRGRAYDPRDPQVIAKSCWSRYAEPVLAGAAWIVSQPTEELTIQSHDGLRLSGRLLPAEHPKGTLLLFHGYRSMAAIDFSCAAQYYHELGYNLILIDQRSHGHSQGTYITYGVLERWDCQRWAEYCYRRFGPEHPLFLDGISMGATTVLLASALPLPPTVRGVIADCGFTSAREIVTHVMRTRCHLPERPLIWAVEFWARILAHVSLSGASTLDAVATTKLPILFLHGRADRFVPCEMTLRAYEACRSEKHLVVVEGAGHGASFLVDHDACTKALEAFLDAHQ